ncbi:uncharacterized protein J3R85_006683 [Psidium guajava]|nr:uncharacterized protein J3R85_006683 [Psidium guajava]
MLALLQSQILDPSRDGFLRHLIPPRPFSCYSYLGSSFGCFVSSYGCSSFAMGGGRRRLLTLPPSAATLSPGRRWGLNASPNCCDRPGVGCSSGSSLGLSDGPSSSVELVLASKKLAGTLSESLGKLDQLRFLNLSRNLLASTLPESLLPPP